MLPTADHGRVVGDPLVDLEERIAQPGRLEHLEVLLAA